MKQLLNRISVQNIRAYDIWLVLLLVCLFFQWLGFEQSLRFDRSQIAEGHWWLLLSAHLVHLGWNHLWLNMAGLLLMAYFFSPYCSRLEWLLLLIFSMLVTGLCLYWLNQDLLWYVGFSGVLHGLFLVGGWYEFKRYSLSGAFVLLIVVGKLIWEQLFGVMPGSEAFTGGRVMLDAHLYGGFSGVLYLLLHQFIHIHDRHQDRQNDQ